MNLGIQSRLDLSKAVLQSLLRWEGFTQLDLNLLLWQSEN